MVAPRISVLSKIPRRRFHKPHILQRGFLPIRDSQKGLILGLSDTVASTKLMFPQFGDFRFQAMRAHSFASGTLLLCRAHGHCLPRGKSVNNLPKADRTRLLGFGASHDH